MLRILGIPRASGKCYLTQKREKMVPKALHAIEWPTLAMLVLTYAVWAIGTLLWPSSGVFSVLLTMVAVAQFSSLQHEVLHGHPFRNQALNDLLVFPGFSPTIPYMRFKDTHLRHHYDPNLTDPYDDPESNFFDPAQWQRMPPAVQAVLRLHNTLLARLILGPAIGSWYFIKGDLALIRAGNRRVIVSWVWHLVGVSLVLAWLLLVTEMPIWAYLVAAYGGYSLLKIRTFLEHRAHASFRARTVIVEDKGPLALLFLNNNLHVVHHMHPKVPWYQLPRLYAEKADHYRRRNDAYVFANYREIFARYLFRAKDPVAHPLWPVPKSEANDADPV